jgi:plasmid stabilization system protein ParE
MTNKRYIITITTGANIDLGDIHRYIANELHAKESADALIKKIRVKIKLLADFPLACPVVMGLVTDQEYRKLVVDNYLVLYKVDDSRKTVFVARVVYAPRNYLTLLNGSQKSNDV